MKKIWIHKARSNKEAREFEWRYYAAMSREERVKTIQWLREIDRRLKKGKHRGGRRKGLQRVITVVQ